MMLAAQPCCSIKLRLGLTTSGVSLAERIYLTATPCVLRVSSIFSSGLLRHGGS
jgi:hypothetical protein